MVDLIRTNAPELYAELLWYMKVNGKIENSRNGPVKVIQHPVIVGITKPNERMIFCPDRMANPFFHIAEAVWMLAGVKDIDWIVQFNKNYGQYAEEDGIVHGAYGYRWRHHFGFDQIQRAISRLTADPTDRRIVIAMWDAGDDMETSDHPQYKDVPCNTQLLFRIVDNALNMTVINRSNDLIWGMMGANVVHMTILQEIIARNVGVKLGRYYVVSNNLHIYEPHWHLMEQPHEEDLYRKENLRPSDIDGYWEDIVKAAIDIMAGHKPSKSEWMEEVAWPVVMAYLDKPNRKDWIELIQSPDVKRACQLWVEWKSNEKKHDLGS